MHTNIPYSKLWSERIIDNEYIAYDVTSISSYSKQLPIDTWGYNKDSEDLPQINLGMFTKDKSKLPILYKVYLGLITDKEQMKYMLNYTKK